MAAAGVAQLVEQLICNQQVISSSLIAGSRIPHKSTLVRVAVTAAEAVRPLHMRKRPRSGIIEPKRRLLSGHRARMADAALQALSLSAASQSALRARLRSPSSPRPVSIRVSNGGSGTGEAATSPSLKSQTYPSSVP